MDDYFRIGMATLITDVACIKLPPKMMDCLATSTLAVLFKNDEKAIKGMQRALNGDSVQPSGPLALSCILRKHACKCVLLQK